VTLGQLCELLNGQLHGNAFETFEGVSSLFESNSTNLTFLLDDKFETQALNASAKALITAKQISAPNIANQIVVHSPKKALVQVLNALYPNYSGLTFSTLHNQFIAHETVQVSPMASIGPNTQIDAHSIIYPNVTLGANCKIGKNCRLYPGVTLYDNTQLGDGVVVHAGTILGADGFGYVPVNDEWIKVPQIGNVIIQDDVEIGANVCIDRGCLGATLISKGTKIDNLTHIAHNVRIGTNCLILGQSGFIGSSIIGNNVIVGGQSGINQVTVGDKAIIASKAGVTKNVAAHETVSGFPAWNHKKELAKEAYIRRKFQKESRS